MYIRIYVRSMFFLLGQGLIEIVFHILRSSYFQKYFLKNMKNIPINQIVAMACHESLK